MDFWAGKRVVVTGGAGFLGRHLCAALRQRGCQPFVPRSAQYDLRTEEGARRLFTDVGAVDVVFHLAATVGGIAANSANPAVTLYDNATMGLHVIHEAHRAGVGKLVCAGSVCAYPKQAPVPLIEANLWLGYPEESNAPYGVAKRLLLTQLQAYRQQYGFNGIYLLLANLYGPGDNFHPETSHVIPALIRRFVEARDTGATEVTLWGTGRATRDFLYVKDGADALLTAAEKYDGAEPVNIATGREINITGLAHTIARGANWWGQIRWDNSKPDGQPRRVMACILAHHTMGWRASTSLEDGIRETIWYWEQQRECAFSS